MAGEKAPSLRASATAGDRELIDACIDMTLAAVDIRARVKEANDVGIRALAATVFGTTESLPSDASISSEPVAPGTRMLGRFDVHRRPDARPIKLLAKVASF